MFRARDLIEFEFSDRESQISTKISDFEQEWRNRISQREFHLFVRDEISRFRCVCKDRKRERKRTNRVRNNWQFRIQLKFVLHACFVLEIWSNSNFQTERVKSRRRYQTSNKNEKVEFRKENLIYLLVAKLADLDVYVKIERKERTNE